MPDFSFENKYPYVVAGIDEAGRGPLAGPVMAGAVVFLDKNLPQALLSTLDDSKKLSSVKREKLYNLLYEQEILGKLLIGLGIASAEEIDSLNILNATFLAMKRAFGALSQSPLAALVDGNQHPKAFPVPTQTIVKGDSLSYSIAAASIIAKVTRDRYMSELAEKYPYYGFEKNAGYGTKLHIEGLKTYGPIVGVHRFSFNPVSSFIKK